MPAGSDIPRVVMEQPAVVSAQSGESVTIECNVTNKSSAYFVTWSLGCGNRTPLPNSDRVLYRSSNQHITIQNLTEEDSGTYYCHVEGAEMGLVSGNGTRLKVTGKPCPTDKRRKVEGEVHKKVIVLSTLVGLQTCVIIILLVALMKYYLPGFLVSKSKDEAEEMVADHGLHYAEILRKDAPQHPRTRLVEDTVTYTAISTCKK
ncbi:signal-regulatory protein beta-2-like [Hyperolius riggenbachi]|uniref:signal-regulatory protein beta-2-like n=1 Tax=Hyperolius riggenbachi TaxID=752182 RepID=UPI0035A3107A